MFFVTILPQRSHVLILRSAALIQAAKDHSALEIDLIFNLSSINELISQDGIHLIWWLNHVGFGSLSELLRCHLLLFYD